MFSDGEKNTEAIFVSEHAASPSVTLITPRSENLC